MRILAFAGLALSAACQAPQTVKTNEQDVAQGQSKTSDTTGSDSNAAVVRFSDMKPDANISMTMLQLWDLPESDLSTECAAADSYADRKVVPAFYDGRPPEFERYAKCLLAEARRDGGRRRLASATSFPKIGTCYSARVTWIGSRVGSDDGGRHMPDRESGTTIVFSNRLNLVDYEYVPQVDRSRLGDRVLQCVHDLPQDCPGDDLRGIGYQVRNLRTGETWIMNDSQHLCRGA